MAPNFLSDIIKGLNYFLDNERTDPCPQFIRSQCLYSNSNINKGNKEPLKKEELPHQVNKVGDLVGWRGEVLTSPSDVGDIIKTKSALGAIPGRWKKVLKGTKSQDMPGTTDESTIFDPGIIYLCGNSLPRSITLTSKMLRKVPNLVTLPAESYFGKKGITLGEQDWKAHYSSIMAVSISMSFRSFHWRVLHNLIYSNNRLYRMGVKESASCPFCKDDWQDIMHLWNDCSEVKKFWEKCSGKWKLLGNLSLEDKTLGDRNNKIRNLLLLNIKQYLYHSNITGGPLQLVALSNKLTKLRKIEGCIAKNKNKLDIHIEKWSTIDETIGH